MVFEPNGLAKNVATTPAKPFKQKKTFALVQSSERRKPSVAKRSYRNTIERSEEILLGLYDSRGSRKLEEVKTETVSNGSKKDLRKVLNATASDR